MTALPLLGSPSRVSGGRDRWSPPRSCAPEDAEAAVWDALREVLDPELPVSLVDLGLIYGVGTEGGGEATDVTVGEVTDVTVDLTYTATACPCQEFIREDIRDRLTREAWVGRVRIEEVWDPPWTSDRITAEGKSALKRFGVVT